jgi:hypothetical protein
LYIVINICSVNPLTFFRLDTLRLHVGKVNQNYFGELFVVREIDVFDIYHLFVHCLIPNFIHNTPINLLQQPMSKHICDAS